MLPVWKMKKRNITVIHNSTKHN